MCWIKQVTFENFITSPLCHSKFLNSALFTYTEHSLCQRVQKQHRLLYNSNRAREELLLKKKKSSIYMCGKNKGDVVVVVVVVVC